MLNSHKVEFLVVGGHAVAFHGYPRFTGDIDFFLRTTIGNANRVIAALGEFGMGGQLHPEDLLAAERVVQLGRPPNRIDLLTSISGVSFDEAWQTRVAAELDGEPVHFPSWDALLKNKRASGRDQDRMDVQELLAIAARGKTS